MNGFLLSCVFLFVMLAVAPAASAGPVDAVAHSAQACSITGTGGADRLAGTAGEDRMCGRGGADRVGGGGAADVLLGGAGGDLLQGKAGSDRLGGGPGADRLFGGAGADDLRGGAGPDALGGGLGPDLVAGGPGRDIAFYGQRGLTVRVTIGRGANDGVAGERDNVRADVEDIFSGRGNDVLIGNGRSNRLIGGAGNDTLRGLGGNDVLTGGAGDDRIDARESGGSSVVAQSGAIDQVVCGGGEDTALVDPADAVDPDCENVIGGGSSTPPGNQPPAGSPPGGANRAPVATPATLDTAEDTPKAVTLAGSDPDGDPLGFAITSPAAHGTLTGTGATRTYTPAADYAGPDSFTFSVNDGRGGTATATVAITVTAVNDAPRLTATTGPEIFTEGGGAIVVDGAIAVTDVDDSELTGATVKITSGLIPADDVLAFTPTAGISGSYDAGTGTLTLAGTATVAEYAAALRTVTFDSPGANPSAGTRTVRFAATDGNDEGETARDVAMTVVNDAPVLTASGGSASHIEGAATTEIDPGLGIADPDSPTMAGATVEITGGLAAGDELLFTAQNGITGNFTGGKLTLTGTATRAQYETALRSVRYRTTSDDPSTAARTITFIVDDGPDESAAATRNVTVAATNDPGSVTTTAGTASFTEQAAPTTVDGNLTVADPDDTQLTGARVEITGGLDAGDMFAFTQAGAITGIYNGGALVLSGIGTVAEYQAALQSVTFTTAGDDPSTAARTIAFSVNDGDGLGPTGARALTVIAVNDRPVLGGVGGSAAYTENGPGTEVAPALTVADPDDTQLIAATVSITAGFDAGDALLFTAQNGITGSFAAGTLTLSGTATLAEYRDALRSVRFATAGDAPSIATRTVTFVVNDSTDLSTAVTRDVTVTAVNDAPTVTTSAGSSTFTEGNGPVTIDPAVGLTDPDSTQITGATVTISANYAGAQEVLAFTNTLTITGTVAGNTLTLTGTDTLVAYAAALRSVTFQNTSNAPSTLPRQITFAATDAQGGTGSGTRNLTVAGVNSAPVLAPATGAVAFAENDPPMAVAPAITVTDSDSAQIQGATVQVTTNFAAGQDVLTFTPTGAVTGSQSGDTLTLSGTDSLATYQTVLRSVRYQNSSDTPSTLTRTLTFTATDTGGAPSNAATRDVTVAATNDAPTNTTSAGAVTYVENGAGLTVDAALQVTDPDSSNATGATARIAGAVSGDLLELVDVPGITDSFAGDTLTLTGTATIAAYQAALRAVTFRSTSENPTNANRTIEFRITDDGGATSPSASRTVQVTPVNDAPATDPTDAAASALEQTATAADAAIVTSDPDSASLTGASVQITANFQSGQDTLQFTNQNGITGNFAAGTLTLTGTATVAQYQTALRSVTYTNTSDTPSTVTRTITFRVTDDGTPGLPSAAQTRDLAVVPVNDAPTDAGESQNATGNTRLEVELTSGGSTLPKRTSATGNLLDNAADVDDAANALSVDTTTVSDPPNGTVSVNADGSYVYTPDVGYTGADSFTYKVKDDENAQSATSTVSITVANRVWYVKNDFAGTADGRSETPFTTLAAADTAATATADTIYVLRGAGTTGLTDTVDLLAQQRLLGQAVNLVVAGTTLFTGTPANRPPLTGTVNLDDANTISGVAIAGSGAAAVAGATGDVAGTIADVTLSGAAGGLDLNATSGTWDLSDLTVATTGGTAVNLTNAGTVNFTAAGTISLTSAAGTALTASTNTTPASLALSGTIDSVTTTSSPTTSISLTNTTGALTIDDINLTTAGPALTLNNANNVTVNNSGDADINSTGPAINLTNGPTTQPAAPDVALDQVSSSGGTVGINIDGIGAGTFTAAGGTLSGHSAAELDINAGTGNITYPGTINNGSGLSVQITGRSGGTVALSGNINDTNDAGGGIDMATNSAGTFTFSGATKKLDTGTGAAFSSTGSSPTINFTGGGLDIDTTTGTGFNATGGGTVAVRDAGNSINSTSGVALNVASTTIGAPVGTGQGGLNFASVSSGNNTAAADPANGIVLNTTGASGGLKVSGDGTGAQNASGGLVQSSTGVGINLTSTQEVSLTQLDVTNTGAHGISATTVTNFTYHDAAIVNAGDGNDEQGITTLNLFGTSLIEDVRLDDIQEDGIQVRQNATDNATADALTIRRLDVEDHQAGFGEAGVEIQTDQASNTTYLLDDSDFAINTNAILGIQLSTASTFTGNVALTMQTNVFQAANAFGSGAMQILGGGHGNQTIVVDNNQVINTKFSPLILNNDFGPGTAGGPSVTRATVTNNNLDGSGDNNNGEGISMRQDGTINSVTPPGGDGTLITRIHNNTITGIKSNQIHVQASDGNSTASNVQATVTNNTGSIHTGGATPFGAGLLIDVGDGSGLARNQACLNASANNLDGSESAAFFDFDITLQLNETNFAALRVTQTSEANLGAVNNGNSTSTFANPPNTILYGQPACTLP